MAKLKEQLRNNINCSERKKQENFGLITDKFVIKAVIHKNIFKPLGSFGQRKDFNSFKFYQRVKALQYAHCNPKISKLVTLKILFDKILIVCI